MRLESSGEDAKFLSTLRRLLGEIEEEDRKTYSVHEENGEGGSFFPFLKLRRFNEIVGWETWTRTRIARFRVWSPTNWTISQPMGGKNEPQQVPDDRDSHDSSHLI